MASGTKSVLVQQTHLYCKNNCNFYGNPSWHGYCSVCYRDVYLKKKKIDDRPLSLVPNISPSFSKFEEKRKQVTSKGTNTFKNLLKKSEVVRAVKTSPQNEQAPPLTSFSSTEFKKIGEEFTSFLKQQPKHVGLDLSKQFKHLMDKLNSTNQLEDYCDLIQDFYTGMTKRVHTDTIYRSVNEDTKQKILDWCESYVTARMYRYVFNFKSEDESKDMEMQSKIRSLHWLTVGLLEARISPDDSYVYDAISCLISVDCYLTPVEKLVAIVQCSSFIFKALNNYAHTCGSGNPASADDFLPALIYVILKANPPRLQSNIAYITRFANSQRLNTGEQGYYFTNLCCAVSFIENLNHESLGLSENKFVKYMSGELSPLTHGLSLSERVHQSLDLLDETGVAIRQLDERCLQLVSTTEAIDKDLRSFVDNISAQIAKARLEKPLRLPVLKDSSHLVPSPVS